MGRNKVDINGINTSELRSLSHEEMNSLFERFSSGDRSVKDKLVEGNLKLVLSILKKYQGKCDNLDDLFQLVLLVLLNQLKTLI